MEILGTMVKGDSSTPVGPPAALQAYLLGTLDLDAALRLQRRLHFDVAGQPDAAALIVCEHPTQITVGRLGSRSHIRCEPAELHARRWPVRWVHRGGGCVLHVPGQLAIYPILPLDRLQLTIPAYVDCLAGVVRDLLADFNIRGTTDVDNFGLAINGRLLAAFGIAVWGGVSTFGMYLNVHATLDAFRLVWCDPQRPEPMTSLERERHGRLRPTMVRERLLEHFRTRFGFTRLTMFSDHPSLHHPPLHGVSEAWTNHTVGRY
jgi:lipoyl(octanoyl) transferase